MKNIEFKIVLPKHKSVEHLKDKSGYNNNFYKLEEYGDWIMFYGNDVLREEYSEEFDCFTYSLGRFADGKYIPILTWDSNDEIIL